jgi:hypothetical protein
VVVSTHVERRNVLLTASRTYCINWTYPFGHPSGVSEAHMGREHEVSFAEAVHLIMDHSEFSTGPAEVRMK